MGVSEDPRQLTRDQLLARHIKGGFWWTRVLSQRLGSVFSLPAIRRGVHPSTLTLGSLLVATVVAVVAIVLLPDQRVAAGLVLLVGWELAYALDCGDGQVARATGRGSVAGARLDLTVDYAGYASFAAVMVVAARGTVDAAVLALAAFAYAFQLFDEASGRAGDAGDPTVDRGGVLYQLAGLARDPGPQRAAAAVGVAVGAWPATLVLLALGCLGALQLVARVVVLDRRSRRGSA
ncbi:hypothetical protein FTX61_03945 [Nitriliruptoraceae bacterium ZYF776]|nr:hypothetical protein [Profundirhabdus halotolerans]